MTDKHPARALNLFGVALDPTDDELKLQFKAILARDLAAGGRSFRSPYEALTGCLQDLICQGVCEKSGEIEVPSWLTPAPSLSDLPLATAENNLRFIDEGGCNECAERVRRFVQVLPAHAIPALVAVDHSMTGGVLRALARKHEPSNLTVLVVDSHFDGLSFSERMDLFRYGQREPVDGCESDSLDGSSTSCPEGAAVRESYNCATWLRHMLDEKVVLQERLIVFGVSDFPTQEMQRDPRLRRYVESYLRFREEGVRFVTKEEIRDVGVRNLLEPLLREMATDSLYVSLDADIGSLDAVRAARFMNVVGLNTEELYQIGRVLRATLQKKELVGLDVSGLETFLLGREFPNGTTDRTLDRLSDFIRILLGHEAMYCVCPSGAGVDPANRKDILAMSFRQR
jgi:arginase family enzyme